MAGFQAFTTGTVALWDLDPYRFPAAIVDDLPDQTPTACGELEPGDHPLPAPEPTSRRLELHAALTTVGTAPLPGDVDATEALCRLGDSTHVTLRRWISDARWPSWARAPCGAWARVCRTGRAKAAAGGAVRYPGNLAAPVRSQELPG
ncbi:hypothetical protein [Streptomyces sp. NPDC086023]|uniref:hypothetical protein n=1 Tax=Streptomyces sp. NPDC086023 TaxID=3365746 RepID=UPI0037D91727